MKILFWLGTFLVLYTMIGYPLLLIVLNKFLKPVIIQINKNYNPKVSIIIAAHNEESIIAKKLENLLSVNYDNRSYEILVASDYSTDETNNIVRDYIKRYPNRVFFVEVSRRMGKTNAQNEAVKKAKGDILVFTDANAMFDADALKYLISPFFDEQISYVCGKLEYTNSLSSASSSSESTYWNIDLTLRKIESDLFSITAGNGSIYAVRKSDYVNIDPVFSHDSVFPPKFVINGKRAVFNERAIAYEKAGESIEDEFSRKVRMSRKIIGINFVDSKKYNFFQHPLFTLFYISHRTFRNSLYLFHLIIYLTNFIVIINEPNLLYILFFIIQNLCIFCGFNIKKINNKYIRFFSYYVITIFAQIIGAKNELTGKSKPFWQKAESTR